LLYWDALDTVRGGFGYDDNVLLSAFEPQGRGFFFAGADLFLYRLPTGPGEFHLYFTGEDRRYFHKAEVGTNSDAGKREQNFLTQANYTLNLWEWLAASITALHNYSDQVLDASDIDARGTIPARGNLFYAAPGLRYEGPANFRAEIAAGASRQLYQAPLSSYWDYGPKLTLGWDYRTNSTVEVATSYLDRVYDDRRQATTEGLPIDGTKLRTAEVRTELAWKHAWDDRARLISTARIFWVHRTDNGSGYYDYNKWGVGGYLRWSGERWTLRIAGRWTAYHYPIQVVSPLDPVARQREEWYTEVSVDYRISKHLQLTALYSYENSWSNVQSDKYQANTVQGGLEWDF
jgi:hypothetical protein